MSRPSYLHTLCKKIMTMSLSDGTDLSGAAILRAPVSAVEEAHDALHNGHITAHSVALEARHHLRCSSRIAGVEDGLGHVAGQ